MRKRKQWNVRLHTADGATDIFEVVDTWTMDGLYMVKDCRGRKWRFPISAVVMITETSPETVKTLA